MDRATRSRSICRWLSLAAIALLGIVQAGCYCTDWRWIWEDDDDECRCYYVVPVEAAGPGGPGD